MSGALDAPGHQGAYEQVATPARKTVARVEHQTGGAYRRNPDEFWLHEIFTPRTLGNALATVFARVGHLRPAVVLAGADDIDLVPSLWGMLAGPELSGLWVNRHAHLVAVAE